MTLKASYDLQKRRHHALDADLPTENPSLLIPNGVNDRRELGRRLRIVLTEQPEGLDLASVVDMKQAEGVTKGIPKSPESASVVFADFNVRTSRV